MKRMPTGPEALWHMHDGGDSAGNCPLNVHGKVELGVPLPADERAASLSRGGGGYVARFAGGYLGLAEKATLGLGSEAFSMVLRLRDPEGTWLGPILGSYGSDRQVSVALRLEDGRQLAARAAAGPAPVAQWLFREGGPRSVYGHPGWFEVVWGAQQPNPARLARFAPARDPNAVPRTLAGDIRNAVMRVGFPAALVDPTAWHDVVIRYTGANLQLWIDGVMLDEEYPLGTTRVPTVPFLIGAGHDHGELKTGFHGLIDHVGLWHRALTPAEITALSGGPEQVRARELAILGDESPRVQYFRPRGHNRKAGDCIPWWDARRGTFRLFYLILRRNHQSKWDAGHGGLEIWQTSTRDLETWEHHPVTVPISEPWEAWNGTGGVGFQDGVYSWFYPCPDYDSGHGGIQLATSTDGVHFEKRGPHPFLPGGDCEIYQDAGGLFHMLRHGPGRRVTTPALRDKTLVAWVRLSDLDQRGGSVLTIEHPDGDAFDAIVFGERAPRRWMPGSNQFRRTPPPEQQSPWPEETAAPDTVVQIAIAYRGTTVTLYRDGELYAAATVHEPVVFPPGSSLIIGRRHMTASPRNSHFHGAVLDARVYDRALDAAELAGLRPNAPGGPSPLAWFDFAADSAADRTGTFPAGRTEGTAHIENGVLRLDEDGHFRSLCSITTLERLTSPDLRTWTPVPEPFIETDVRNVAMCPHLFPFGDWYYFIGGTQWFRSRHEFGPWEKHRPVHLCELFVPKTAPFGRARRIYAGFLRDGGWGGNEVLRELVQDRDGWLGTRFVPEMIPACGDPIPLGDGTTRRISERAPVTIPGVPQDCRIQLQVEPGPGLRALVLVLRDGPADGDGCELRLDLGRGTAAYAKMSDSAGNVSPGPAIRELRTLERPFSLDILCRHDIVDAEIGGFRATCTRFWNPAGDRLRLVAEGGAVDIHDLSIRPLTERYEPYPGWRDARRQAR
ncbi:MAG: hypothetical protein JXR77_12675 [Lentisphaeria bacterium]|nr:hypothetical protein [Lentisphaeria bacterium]